MPTLNTKTEDKQLLRKKLLLCISVFWIFFSASLTVSSMSADKLRHYQARVDAEHKFAETCDYRGGFYKTVKNESGSFDAYCIDRNGKKTDFYFEPFKPLRTKEFLLRTLNYATLNIFE